MKRPWILVAVISIVLAAIDQISKFAATNILEGGKIEFLKGFFHFELSTNPGVAFGLPVPFLLILVLNVILLIAIIYFFHQDIKIKNAISITSLSLILGGAFGNIIDRLLIGEVIDFIGVYKWPFFNLADSFICLGILLLISFYAKINRVKQTNDRK
jgi:signal peptidase II